MGAEQLDTHPPGLASTEAPAPTDRSIFAGSRFYPNILHALDSAQMSQHKRHNKDGNASKDSQAISDCTAPMPRVLCVLDAEHDADDGSLDAHDRQEHE